MTAEVAAVMVAIALLAYALVRARANWIDRNREDQSWDR